MAKDPARQYASPYLGMGNNPISQVDPDGAYSKPGAAWRNFLFGNGSDIYKSDGEWGYRSGDGNETIHNFGEFGKNWGDQHHAFSPNFQSVMKGLQLIFLLQEELSQIILHNLL